MKKIYLKPETKTVLVKVQSLLTINSLQGEASSSSVGFSRESKSDWEDEDDDY